MSKVQTSNSHDALSSGSVRREQKCFRLSFELSVADVLLELRR